MPKIPTAPTIETTERLYPVLEPEDNNTGSNYRLTEIRNLERKLEKEIEDRSKLYKKYRRSINIVDGIDTVLILSCLGMGATGVGLLSTIIAAPIVIALEAAAGVCGLAGIAGKFVSRRLLVKAKKHDEIRVLALSKLNSVSDVISQALQDGHISPEEFKLVINEINKYRQIKADIQKKSRKVYAAQTNEVAKNELMAEARASIMKELAATTLK